MATFRIFSRSIIGGSGALGVSGLAPGKGRTLYAGRGVPSKRQGPRVGAWRPRGAYIPQSPLHESDAPGPGERAGDLVQDPDLPAALEERERAPLVGAGEDDQIPRGLRTIRLTHHGYIAGRAGR